MLLLTKNPGGLSIKPKLGYLNHYPLLRGGRGLIY